MEFIQLLLVYFAGAVVHGAYCKGVFREGDYFFYRGFACHNHHYAVKPRSNAAVGRGTVFKGFR